MNFSASKLAPVGPAALDRLRDLYAMAPLYSTAKHREVDAELKRAGWIDLVKDEDDGTTVAEMSPAAYRPDGTCCLYTERGLVHECWIKAESTVAATA
jgi:hypothetical protein